MKKLIFILYSILSISLVYAQTVEKIFESYDIHSIISDEEFEGGKSLGIIYTSNLESEINIYHPFFNKHYIITEGEYELGDNSYSDAYGWFFKLNNYYYFESPQSRVSLLNLNHEFIGNVETATGICFILKKENTYIFYFVDKMNKPAAIDGNGKIYNSIECMTYLKLYDSDKYEKSREYAEKIGLLGLFDLNEILIWDNTLYSSIIDLKIKYNLDENLFYRSKYPVSYDLNGIGYQCDGLYHKDGINFNNFMIVKEGKKLLEPICINSYSNIIQKRLQGKQSLSFKSYDHVDLSGNIYFYISDETETEVFRIRNTWDSSNLYALAINGYTEDFYGKYVTDVLSKMSKADLRLLRNTVFALYGVHFKSEDLAKYFDKQVWYTDEGKSSGEITLPENRQKLVEMILKLEK